MNIKSGNNTVTMKRFFIALGVVAFWLFCRDMNDDNYKLKIESKQKIDTCFNIAKQKNDPDWINACLSMKEEHVNKFGGY